MKINKLIYLFAIIIGIGFTSCEEEALVGTSKLADVVYLSDSITTAGEDAGTITVIAYRSTSNFSQALTVDLEISAEFVSDSDVASAGDDASSSYTINKTSLNFDAGVSSDTIVISPIDDLAASGDKAVSITLANPSVGSYSTGTASDAAFYGAITVVIGDNDCPFESVSITDWVGTYSVDENFTAGVNSPLGLADFFGESYQLEIALDPNDASGTRVIITNSAGFNTYLTDGIGMQFLTCSGEVVFTEAAPNLALFADFEYETAVYNEGNLSIKVEGPLQTFGAYQFTLTKQ